MAILEMEFVEILVKARETSSCIRRFHLRDNEEPITIAQ